MIALLHLLVGAMALLGAPLFIVISLGTLIGYSSAEIPPSSLFAAMGAVLDKPHLLPIVLFIFSGYLLAHSGTPRRAVRLAEALFALCFRSGEHLLARVPTKPDQLEQQPAEVREHRPRQRSALLGGSPRKCVR